MTDPTDLNTIAKWVSDTYAGQYITISEAAKVVGRSSRTLKRWKAAGKVEAPRHFVEIGTNNYKVNLYNTDDLDELRTYVDTVKPGRPRINEPCGA